MATPRTDHSGGGTRGWRRDAAIACAVAAVVAIGWMADWLPALENPVADLLMRLPCGRAGDPPVAAVLIDDASVRRLGPLPWPRERLARVVYAVRDSGAAAVVLDLILAEDGGTGGDEDLAGALAAGPAVLAATLSRDRGWILPLAAFGGSRAAAHAHAEIGPDGVVRTIAATKQSSGLSLPALCVAAARLVDPTVPVTAGATLRPDFRPPPQAVPRVSAEALLADRPGDSILRDRVVLVGISASGAGDQLVVPTMTGRSPQPGVLVHASATASLLRGGLIAGPQPWWAILGSFLVSGVTSLFRTRAGALRPLNPIVAGATLVLLCALTLIAAHTLMPVVTLVLALVATTLVREGVESRLAQRETGALLATLIERSGAGPAAPVPASASGRLALVRRLQQQVLRENELRQTLLEGLGEGVVLWDDDGNHLLSNAATERLWGHRPGLAEVMATVGESGRQQEFVKVVKHRGRHLAVASKSIAAGRLALIRDVTAERRLERHRREMQRLVSHELKTPLSSISGFAGMLGRYDLSPAELQRVAGMIGTESERLQEMVTTFLDLERLGSGHWQQQVEVVDFAGAVEERVGLLEAAARPRSQVIDMAVASRRLVRGVTALLGRVVDNLLGNALKYSPEGSTVEVRVKNSGDQVLLEVRDEGAGIPTEALPRIFERFFRVAGAEATGSGLGLALVKEIVDWHGGCITVDSEVGAGSTFTVTLPAVGDEEDDGTESSGG